MFTVVFSRASHFKRLISTVKDIITECNVDCTPEGLSIQALDSSRVSMVSLFINARSPLVCQYECERRVTIGLRMDQFHAMVNLAPSDRKIALRSETDGISLCFEGPYTELTIPTIILTTEEVDIPEEMQRERMFPVGIRSASEFARIVTKCQQLSDQLIIEVVDSELKLLVDGQSGNGGVTLSLPQAVQRPVRMLHNMRLVHLLTKSCSTYKDLSLWVANHAEDQLPTVFDYQLEDQFGYIKFYLAEQNEQ